MIRHIHKGKLGCEVEVICDSINAYNRIRLTTVRLRYWRPIHAELMTHRVFSRNARSSRAVPVATLLKEEPFIPRFQQNMPGMQAKPLEAMEGHDLDEWQADCEKTWNELIQFTRNKVQDLVNLGVHKQWANRPLEFFGFIDVLVTSTDWANWFALRDHPDAAPEIHDLAETMAIAIGSSSPQELSFGEWHLPYITEEDRLKFAGDFEDYRNDQLKILSAARCARISYAPFDGDASHEKERDRYIKLVGSQPVHASPTEHQATPDYMLEMDLGKGQFMKVWQNGSKHGNFTGWIQHRKEIPGEAVQEEHNYAGF